MQQPEPANNPVPLPRPIPVVTPQPAPAAQSTCREKTTFFRFAVIHTDCKQESRLLGRQLFMN